MKTIVNSTSDSELEFAYKVRRALDERIADLPQNTVDRLSAARRIAVANKKPDSTVVVVEHVPSFAGVLSSKLRNSYHGSSHWFLRVSIIVPMLILAIGSVSLYQYEEARRVNALAELDAAVLADELPIDAYLDHGFNDFLNKHGD